MDTLTPEQRHRNMASIKSSGTSIEKNVRSALHKFGFRFRKNDCRLPGKPDIVFPHYWAVIFVNGCFWHAHEGCSKSRLPKKNTEYWKTKLLRNRERDQKEIDELLKQGWRVGIVWECSITGKKRAAKIQNVAEEISQWLEEGFSERFRQF